MSPSLAADSTCNALGKYLFKHPRARDFLVHSDRGIQYASEQFRSLLESVDATQSMSRKGNCWDNAVIESFFHTLKTRMIYHHRYRSMDELMKDLYWYIEIYYNRVRKHSTNGWLTPEEKKDKYYRESRIA